VGLSFLLSLGLVACEGQVLEVDTGPLIDGVGFHGPPDLRAGAAQAPGWYWVTEMEGFSWVIDAALAGLPLPGGRRDLDDDLRFLHYEGLDLLISLTEEATDPEQVVAFEMDAMHLPIEDYTAPEPEQIDEFVAEVARRLEVDDKVGVHCWGGLGRTGTMLATWFVHEGMGAEEAIAHVRELRPGSIETEEQEQAIYDYADRLGGATG